MALSSIAKLDAYFGLTQEFSGLPPEGVARLQRAQHTGDLAELTDIERGYYLSWCRLSGRQSPRVTQPIPPSQRATPTPEERELARVLLEQYDRRADKWQSFEQWLRAKGFLVDDAAQLREMATAILVDPDALKPGDTAVVLVDGTELYDEHNIVARLPKGTEIFVFQLSGSWIGAGVMVDGEPKTGWIDSRKVGNPPPGRFHEQNRRNRDLENHQVRAKPWKASDN
jgi:hypothetical protein